MEEVITVKDGFGKDIKINRAEFVERWVDHAREMRNLDWDEFEAIDDICEKVSIIASNKFTKLLASEHGRFIFFT